jgi:formyl-CoA transferase
MLADEHFAAREALTTLVHRTLGEFTQQSPAPRLSDTPGRLRWLGPELGAHTSEVLTGVLGLSDADVRELAARRVV